MKNLLVLTHEIQTNFNIPSRLDLIRSRSWKTLSHYYENRLIEFDENQERYKALKQVIRLLNSLD